MKFTVIIPTRNRQDGLIKSVESVLNTTYKDFEIVVVDQNPSDDTLFKLENLSKKKEEKHKIHYFRSSKVGVAAGRNEGIKASKSEYVVITDDDCIAERDWLLHYERGFNDHPDVGIIMGSVKRGEHDISQGTIPGFQPHDVKKINTLNDLELRNLGLGMGANCAIRRSVFNTIGLFDEICIGADDWEFFIRAVLCNIPIMIYPDAVVYHMGFRSWNNIIKLSNKYMFDYTKVLIKYIRLGFLRFILILAYQLMFAWYINPRHRKFIGLKKILRYAANKYWYCFRGIYTGLFLKIDKKTMMFLKK